MEVDRLRDARKGAWVCVCKSFSRGVVRLRRRVGKADDEICEGFWRPA